MENIVLYSHGGSENHGCEALARTTAGLIKEQFGQNPTVISSHPEEDIKYIKDTDILFTNKGKNLNKGQKIIAKIWKTLTKSLYFYDKTEMKAIVCDTHNSLCISIGGDNYCYSDFDYYGRMNSYLGRHNNNTVLWGCSVEPELLKNSEILCDLGKYSLITARESITYESMIESGLTNVKYCPDSAFLLPVEEFDLPEIFERSVIGINVSPMVMGYEGEKGIVMENYRTLIHYILEKTDMNIAFIPHVIWDHNDDLVPLTVLYEEFKDNKRVSLIDSDKKMNCCQLKYLISKCAFMVTARTHASIAAYSTGVPTLVTGYSVKAKGIAQDIFGDYKGYVSPVQEFRQKNDLLKDFLYVVEHREEMLMKMAIYTERAKTILQETTLDLGTIK